jgi:hypothetical protein
MADFALFIGWGMVKPGREQQALEHFAEAQQYNEKLKQRGDAESYETVLLELHGGDLGGFTLLRGSADKLNRLRYEDEEFLSLLSKASLLVDDLGVVGAAIGGRIMRQVGVMDKAVRSLQPIAAGAR